MDNSPIQPRSLPGYSFNPLSIGYPTTNLQPTECHKIEEEANKAQEQHLIHLNQ